MKEGLLTLLILAILLNLVLVNSNPPSLYYSTPTLSKIAEEFTVRDFIDLNNIHVFVLPLRVVMISNKTFYTIVPKLEEELNISFSSVTYISNPNKVLILAGSCNGKPFIGLIRDVNTYGLGVHEVAMKIITLNTSGSINDLIARSNGLILFAGIVQVNSTKHGFYGHLTLNDVMNLTTDLMNISLIKDIYLVRIVKYRNKVYLVNYHVNALENNIKVSLLEYSKNFNSGVMYYNTFSIPCPECTITSRPIVISHYDGSLLLGIINNNLFTLKYFNISNQLLISFTVMLGRSVSELSFINLISGGIITALLRFNDLSKLLLINMSGNSCRTISLNKSVIALVSTNEGMSAVDLSGKAFLITSTLVKPCVLSNVSYMVIDGVRLSKHVLKLRLPIQQKVINLLIIAKPYFTKSMATSIKERTTVKRTTPTPALNVTPIRFSEEAVRKSKGMLLIMTGIILLAIYVILRYRIKV